MSISYEQLLKEQKTYRRAFGDMLLRWRLANDWKVWDFVPHGLWEQLEAGTAGELQRKTFFALGELNQLQDSIPLGDFDGDTTRWTAVEFWACYCGLRPVPGRWSGR